MKSGTGIYHVMMRGVNRQTIFNEEEDFNKFIWLLESKQRMMDDAGQFCGIGYEIYAYCLMTNHFHLLIREREEEVGATMKRIAVSYTYYYNRKYERDGHLFRERFRSEPVNDMDYFQVLLRYIHQNPLKARMVENVRDYKFSSWGEYDGEVEPYFHVCNTRAVTRRIPFNILEDFVNEPLDDSFNCLEDDKDPRVRLSDDQVCGFIMKQLGTADCSDIRHMEKSERNELLRKLMERGASIRQLERITGINRGVFQRMILKMH